MRLTLRTLLALLDNVLSPADAQVLSKKVQESPKAEQLAQRIRLVLGRNDLSAAPALGEGVDDANIAAEYLDSTLSEADIAAFEHYCLSSDIRLSEVADCHKVLAEVLTRPSHVPPELRERAYRLAAGVLGTSPAWATSPGATNGGAAGLAGGSIADAPTAPLPPGSSSSHTFAPLEGPAAVTGAAAVNFTGLKPALVKRCPATVLLQSRRQLAELRRCGPFRQVQPKPIRSRGRRWSTLAAVTRGVA